MLVQMLMITNALKVLQDLTMGQPSTGVTDSAKRQGSPPLGLVTRAACSWLVSVMIIKTLLRVAGVVNQTTGSKARTTTKDYCLRSPTMLVTESDGWFPSRTC